VVVGVSPDDVDSHAKFKRKYHLPFSLLADTEHAVAELYGVWQQKSLFGVKYWGNVRTTFLVAPDGTVAHVFDKVKSSEHGEEVARWMEERA
jgi:peroxiredoxin Q/BCP